MNTAKQKLSSGTRQYSAPRLTCFGTVAQLTTTGSGAMWEIYGSIDVRRIFTARLQSVNETAT